ncbi:MAG TPA: 4a-hydroxytetrahydrobiopterin dehydratase [Candidatus Binataceae bacterium]|nr:4a-hydroxytetrahydrobiopterin dehydratase [Candidatus Binataceae bacterium]
MAILTPERIADQLRQLPGWEFKDNAICKLYRFKEFMQGIRFIDRIAELADAMDHHPDIHVNYTRVTFTCSTHSEGGVTDKDLRLATTIEQEFSAASR